MTWVLCLTIDGEDACPQLRAVAEDPRIFAQDKVRFELLRQLGWSVSESSEHTAEYTPYFLRRDDQITKYDVPVDKYIRRSGRNLRRYDETRQKLLARDSFPLERSVEFGAIIIYAMMTGTPQLIYGNVRNTRLIDNLLENCCVQLPVVVDRNGLRPYYVGTLPPELATHCAALDGDRERVYRAAVLDRHAVSVH